MSEVAVTRLARKPTAIPKGVEISMVGQLITAKGAKGTLSTTFHRDVLIEQSDGTFTLAPKKLTREANMHTGTSCALLRNMLQGVSDGFEKHLQLVGVGYRAKLEGKQLHLTLGLSHPVVVDAPEGITFSTPDQTSIVVSGIDKQLVGQISAIIRSKRPPEPYKKKGIRYKDEVIIGKEAKKK